MSKLTFDEWYKQEGWKAEYDDSAKPVYEKIWDAALQSGASDSGGKCYLHIEQKDGVFMVIDDLGRRVEIRGVTVKTSIDDPVLLTIKTFDYNSENKPHLNKPNKKAP